MNQECDLYGFRQPDSIKCKKYCGDKDKQNICIIILQKDRDAYKEAVINEKPDLVLGRKTVFWVSFVDLPRKIQNYQRKLGVYTIGKIII